MSCAITLLSFYPVNDPAATILTSLNINYPWLCALPVDLCVPVCFFSHTHTMTTTYCFVNIPNVSYALIEAFNALEEIPLYLPLARTSRKIKAFV